MFFSVQNIWESLGHPEIWNSYSASQYGAVWENLRSQIFSDCLQEEHNNCVPVQSWSKLQIWNDETKKLWSRWLIRKLLHRGTCDRRHSLTFLCRPLKFLLHPQGCRARQQNGFLVCYVSWSFPLFIRDLGSVVYRVWVLSKASAQIQSLVTLT